MLKNINLDKKIEEILKELSKYDYQILKDEDVKIEYLSLLEDKGQKNNKLLGGDNE